MKLKNNKGFTQVDIVIAIMIVITFVSLIAALFTNLGLEYKKVERKTVATNIAIETIEAIKRLDYADVKDAGMTIDEINNLLPEEEKISISQGYTVNVDVLNYKDYEQNSGLEIEDVIKKVTVKIDYTVGKSSENITLETLITAQ